MRLFAGLELPPAWRRALAAAAAGLERAGVHGRFTRPENFHLTLVFLGETGQPELAAAALDQVRVPPFPLRAAAPGRFAKRGGDIWWLGVEPHPGLLEAQHQLEAALRAAGFAPEARPFRPHITLARQVRAPAGLEPADTAGLFPPLACTIRRLTLFSSQQADGALRYLPVARRCLM